LLAEAGEQERGHAVLKKTEAWQASSSAKGWTAMLMKISRYCTVVKKKDVTESPPSWLSTRDGKQLAARWLQDLVTIY
jgi:hypothetical protein